MDTFDLGHVKVILGSFHALFSKLGHNSKMAHCRVKQTKYGLQDHMTFTKCLSMGTLSSNMSRAFWGPSVHFSRNWSATQRWLTVDE